MERRALRRDADGITLLQEQRVPLESDLQKAFVDHPEALPAEDLGLQRLVSIGWELDFGAGPMDQLAVDTTGQLVLVEYKKGTENPDVRKVIAQLLDYGSALWRRSVDELQRRCADNGSYSLTQPDMSLADHVSTRVGEDVNTYGFTEAVQRCLESGSFVFLYVARDLDDRTRRVMTYLAEGVNLRFFAVEMDWFGAVDGSAVLVPRVAYVPASVAAGPKPPTPVDPAVEELMTRIKAIADDAGVPTVRTETGWSWGTGSIVGVYRSSRGFSVSLPELTEALDEQARDQARAALEAAFADRTLPPAYPAVPCSAALDRWSKLQPWLSELFAALPTSPVR